MVLDIDGTVVVINANLWAGSSAADRAEFAAVLDSIRIDPRARALPNVPTEQLDAGDVLRRRGLRNTDAADLRHHRRRVEGSFRRRGMGDPKRGPHGRRSGG